MRRQVTLNVSGRARYGITSTYVHEGESKLYEFLNTLLRLELYKPASIDRFDLRRYSERLFDRTEIKILIIYLIIP